MSPTQRGNGGRGGRGRAHISGLVGVPQLKQPEQRPLDALDALLLALRGVLGAEGQGVDVGPVGEKVEVEEAAQEAWSQRIVQGAGRFATMAICTPSYINNEGHVADPNATPEEMIKRARGSPYSGGIIGFIKELDKWNKGDKLPGIEVTIS